MKVVCSADFLRLDTIALYKKLDELKVEQFTLRRAMVRAVQAISDAHKKQQAAKTRPTGQKCPEEDTATTRGSGHMGIVYTAVQCDSCRTRGMPCECVWQSGTNASCIPCQKATQDCMIGGMYIKSLKVHHQLPPGANQATSVVAELTPTPVNQVDDLLHNYIDVADCMQDILIDQRKAIDALSHHMRKVRTMLSNDNTPQQSGSGSAVSEGEEVVLGDIDMDE